MVLNRYAATWWIGKRRTSENLSDICPETIQKMGIAESVSYAHFERSICVAVCFCASDPRISLHHFGVGWHRDIWNYNSVGYAKKHGKIKQYWDIWSGIELWDQVSRPRYLISFISKLLCFQYCLVEGPASSAGFIFQAQNSRTHFNFLLYHKKCFFNSFYDFDQRK